MSTDKSGSDSKETAPVSVAKEHSSLPESMDVDGSLNGTGVASGADATATGPSPPPALAVEIAPEDETVPALKEALQKLQAESAKAHHEHLFAIRELETKYSAQVNEVSKLQAYVCEIEASRKCTDLALQEEQERTTSLLGLVKEAYSRALQWQEYATTCTDQADEEKRQLTEEKDTLHAKYTSLLQRVQSNGKSKTSLESQINTAGEELRLKEKLKRVKALIKANMDHRWDSSEVKQIFASLHGLFEDLVPGPGTERSSAPQSTDARAGKKRSSGQSDGRNKRPRIEGKSVAHRGQR